MLFVPASNARAVAKAKELAADVLVFDLEDGVPPGRKPEARSSIARALLLNPKLLMLDEPSQGLAPLIVEEVFRVVTAARREGVSVLLVEQNVRAAVQIDVP